MNDFQQQKSGHQLWKILLLKVSVVVTLQDEVVHDPIIANEKILYDKIQNWKRLDVRLILTKKNSWLHLKKKKRYLAQGFLLDLIG